MKSKTKIESQLRRKTNPELVETIILAKKNQGWREVAAILTGPRRNRRGINLAELDKSPSKSVVICGKVLSGGDVSKKKKVIALGFSEKAREKLRNAGCETKLISEEIKLNKDAKGVEILK